MSNKAKQAILPKIRFPDFQDAPEWDKKRLDEVARFVNDRLPLEKLSVNNYISTENILPNFRGITISAKLPTTTTATKFKANDILISNIRPYLKKIWLSNTDGGASNDVIVLRSKETIVTNFLSSVLKSDDFINYVMKGAKGVKMPRGDLSLIKEYLIAYPFDKKEQQKIADCLSSIDELITAEGKKLDAFKAHKKGLMQQLFPAKGATLPKLRFSEFRNAGNWEEIALQCIAKPVTDKVKATTQHAILTLSSEQGLISQNEYFGKRIAGENLRQYTKIIENDFVYNDRTTKLSNYGTIKKLSKHEAGVVSPIYKCFRFNKEENFFYWESYFESGMHESQLHTLINEGARSGRFNISIQKFLSTLAKRPKPEEQKKIADCLTSLEELIKAEEQKLDVLHAHKKGIMQQLFPSMSEISE